MKYFGQYLVSKGIISDEVLVDALIEQFTSLPTAIEVVRKKKLMPTPRLLDVFICQTERRMEFKQACIELGTWSPEIEKNIKNELESSRTPLGQILIKKGVVDLQAMTRALDEFLSKIESVPAAHEEEKTISHPIDPGLLEEFSAFLSDEKLENMRKLFSLLEQSSEKLSSERLSEIQKQLFTEFKSLKGLMRFIRLQKSEALVSKIENLILFSINQCSQGDVGVLPQLSEIGQTSIDLLASLKSSLLQSHSEEAWLKNPELSVKIDGLQKKLMNLGEELNEG